MSLEIIWENIRGPCVFVGSAAAIVCVTLVLPWTPVSVSFLYSLMLVFASRLICIDIGAGKPTGDREEKARTRGKSISGGSSEVRRVRGGGGVGRSTERAAAGRYIRSSCWGDFVPAHVAVALIVVGLDAVAG